MFTRSGAPSSRQRERGSSFLRPARRVDVRAASLMIMLLVVAAACTGTGLSASASATASANPTPSVTAASTSEFPLTVVDDEGTSVELAHRPERIASLTPGTTEILFAIGAGDRVIATTDFDDYPAEAEPLPDVASFGSVDLERIVELEADLVFAGGNGYTPPEAIRRLRELEIPVIAIYAATVDGVAADVELIGTAVGSETEADAIADRMRTEIAAISYAVADAPRPRVFYEIDASAGLFGPADDSFLAEMIELAGGEPITTGSDLSFEMDLERLVTADPEVIVLGDAAFGTTAEQVAERPAWVQMTAVRSGAIRVADDRLITRPGPRLALGLRSLVLAIHPDAQLP